MRVLSLIALAFALAACGNETSEPTSNSASYDADWDAEALLTAGKADGIFDITAPLEFGGSQAGQVGGSQVNVYKMKLVAGDDITLTAKVTDGDLNPHVSLYYGTSSYISSASWNLDDGVLTKNYKTERTGNHLIAVRAYRGEGSGKYILTAACNGGPCNGEFVEPEPEEFELGDANDCIIETRTCAFDRMGRYNGAVGPARAKALWNECLAEQTPGGGISCIPACEGEMAELCNSVIKGIEFYADQSDECLSELNYCFSDCEDYGSDWSYGWGEDEGYNTPAWMCWEGIWNGDCDSYARGHEFCGGTEYKAETYAACSRYCESTTGAWIDDLDVICEESCEEYCDAEVIACAEVCGGNGDPDCESECLDHNEAWGCF